MKRLSLIFVLGVSAILLTGCDGYKKISEEEFNSYFSAEKISAAKENFAAIKTFNFKTIQTTTEFDYELYRYFDADYYYQYAFADEKTQKNYSHDLYLGSSNISDCKWYAVTAEGVNKVTVGQQAFNEYDERVRNDKGTITNSMDDPFYYAKEFSENVANKQYYLGRNSLKVTFKSPEGSNDSLSGKIVFNSKTLLIASCEIHLKTTEGSGTIKFNFSYNKSFKHKMPNDIGYKESV